MEYVKLLHLFSLAPKSHAVYNTQNIMNKVYVVFKHYLKLSISL